MLIGENIVVTVVNIDRDKIRLGITAPRRVAVVRAELVGTEAERGIREAAEGR